MRSFRSRMAGLVLALAAIAVVASSFAQPANAQAARQSTAAQVQPTKAAFDPITAEGYIEPPEPLRSLVDAPRNNMISFAAGSRKFLMRTLTENMPALNQLGAPHYNLAGWQIDSRANRSRNLTSRSLYGIELYDTDANKTIKVDIPAGARANAPAWSPDGSTLAYFALFDNATHIYLFNPATGKSRALTKTSVLATNVTSYNWTGDGKSIIAVLAPEGRPGEPQPPLIAPEPMVRVNEGTTLRTRTLPDVLMSPFEKTLVEYHSTGQLAVIDVKTGAVKKVGTPGMITALNAAPDAMFFRVTYRDTPFSYYQPLTTAGQHEVLIDATGKVIKELSRRVMREGSANDPDPDPVDPNDPNNPVDPNDPNAAARGAGAGRTGGAAAQGRGNRAGGAGRGGDSTATQAPDTSRRSLNWHPYLTGQMFYQLAPVAAGAPATTPRNDRMMIMPNPADSNVTKVLYETANRIQNVRYSENGRIMFVTESSPPVPGAAAPAAAGGDAGGGRRGGGAGGGGGAARGGGGGGGGGGGAQGGGAATTTYEIAVFLDENNAKFTISQGRGGGGGGAAPAAARGGGGGGGGAGGRGGAGGGGGGGGGGFVMKPGKLGFSAVMISTDGKFIYTQGTGPAPNDTTLRRPMVEKIEIKTGTRSPVWQSTSRLPETVTTPLDDDFKRVLVRRESSQDPPQQFIVDTRTNEARQITQNKDIWNGFRAPQRQTYFARRADGVPIRVYVTKPRNYVEGTKMPALFWFYPSEFDSAAAYTNSIQGGRGAGGGGGRGAGAPPAANSAPTGTFPSYAPRTMSFITEVGYVLVEPDAPIIGETNVRPNDNYVRDLTENLQAVINMLDTLRIIDRNRLALGGHSYGAFSTVNAMVNTSFFKAGIAGDGNYNRTLTPNGFQNERRDLWQGTETYLNMSPFLKADKLSGALLLYHSIEDQNVGTDPINSPKLFHALQGLGKTVSMYMYPYEDHGPVARETVLDQWARWVAWLDKYVKNADKQKVLM